MALAESDKAPVISILNHILETELAGVIRYTHYSLVVYGFGRIPIVKWLRAQADEGLRHAEEAGEMVTHFGGEPSLTVGPAAGSLQPAISVRFCANRWRMRTLPAASTKSCSAASKGARSCWRNTRGG
ncbi:MAG: ferritin-like domain-containing protein [Rhodospirillales bacterium]